MQTKLVLGMALVLVAAVAPVGAATLLQFDFSGATNTSASNSQNSTFSASGVSSSVMTRGAGISANNAANSFRGTGFSNDGVSVSNTDYFQFSVSAASGYRISISSIYGNFNGTGTFSASPGVTMAYAYSVNGGSTFTLMDTFVRVGSGNATYSISSSYVAALSGVESVIFRLYASGQTSTGGWGLQSAVSAGTVGLAVDGTVSAVPEPSAYVFIAGVGVAGWAVVTRRRRPAYAAVGSSDS